MILADSLSTDRTVEIASNYPIKIVQLVNESDRSCGIGAELGMVAATGEFIYILDADMVFIKGFLLQALKMLENDLNLAGVAGMVQEQNKNSIEFKERMSRKKSAFIAVGEVSALAMGGLYRKTALESVKYFTHRGLNSYEEFELGARLRVNGWKMLRMKEVPSVEHYGYKINPYKLLIKRVKSGYIYGVGELLRSSYGQAHFLFVLKNLTPMRVFLGYSIWILSVLIGLLLVSIGYVYWLYVFLFILLPFVVMSIKKRSVERGVYSVTAGTFHAYGLVVGFFKGSVKNPVEPINFIWKKK